MSTFVLVHVRVIFPDGDPAEEAFLNFEESDPPLPEMALVTNSQGETRMSLPLGRYRLAARKGQSHGEVSFEIGAKSATKRLTIVLSEAGPN